MNGPRPLQQPMQVLRFAQNGKTKSKGKGKGKSKGKSKSKGEGKGKSKCKCKCKCAHAKFGKLAKFRKVGFGLEM